MANITRILLVGSTGRVGRLVVPHLQTLSHGDVDVVAQHRDPARSDGWYWPIAGAAPQHFPQRIDAIISLAGVTPGQGGDLSANTTLTQSVLQAAYRNEIPRVLVASSSAIYGARGSRPFSEEETPAPLNAYGAAKQKMEADCQPWRDKGLEVCCLRIGNVAGADALLQNVARARPDMPVTVDRFADGTDPCRSYIGPATLALVLKTLAGHKDMLPQALNIAAPTAVLMEDIAQASGHPYRFRPAPSAAYQRITLDCRRLAALYPFAGDDSDPSVMVTQWKEAVRT